MDVNLIESFGLGGLGGVVNLAGAGESGLPFYFK